MANDSSTAAKRRAQAKRRLGSLFRDADNFHIIHYSCESFYGQSLGTSRRVTSISILNIGSQQQMSFSIHTTAENLRAAKGRRQRLVVDSIRDHYDEIERAMLTEYFGFLEAHPNAHWLHWNMRDTAYGFKAIEQRFKSLGGTPHQVPTSHLFNLADALTAIYGKSYVGHPHMYSLIKLNDVTDKDLLTGVEEAEAFENQEYVKLHFSTLRKVQAIATLAQLQQDGKLKTKASFWQRHGATPAGIIDDWTSSWLYRGATLFVLVGSFVSLMVALIRSVI